MSIELVSASENGKTAWTPPPLDECYEQRFNVPLDDSYLLSCRRVLWNSQLVGFAVVLSFRSNDEWSEVVCIDTMHHNSVHRHDDSHEAFTKILEIHTQQDVQESYPDAYDEVYNVYLRAVGEDQLR